MSWIKTSDRLPEKPGIKRYEQIPCLVVRAGRRGHVELLVWNCEHLCWDDSEGDDHDCDPYQVSHWMPLPEPPKE